LIEIYKIDIEELKRKNLSIEFLTKELDNKIEESSNIKNLILAEKEKLFVSLDDVINEIKEFFTKMINELKTKVNQVNEKLEYYLKKYNNEIELSKKISEEAKKYNYEEKNNFKLISYIYKLDKTYEKMNNLMSEQIYSLKYSFDINNKEIIYEEPKINNINKKYSYLCLNRSNLMTFITKGTDNTTIEIALLNDGKMDWLPNAKLVFDNNSHIKADDIILNPQKCNEEQTYKINFNNLSNLNIGKYECYLWFNIDGENFGDKISLMIKVNENNDSNEIDIFRESFNISKSSFSDEQLIDVLQKADHDIELAFSYLFMD
jgi:hypothetical protein